MAGDQARGEEGEDRGFVATVFHGLIHDHSFHYAAGTAFRVTLAVFPLVLALVSVLTLLGSGERTDEVLEAIGRTDAVPGRTTDAIRDQLDEIDEPGPNHVIGAAVAFALALWSSAAAFRTIMSGLNRSLGLTEHRGLIRRFFVSLGLATITACLAVAATVLVAEGPVVEGFVESLPGGSGHFRFVWDVVRFPVIAALVFSWLAVSYAWGPADHQRFRLVTPGIVIAFLLWLAFALLFSWYVDAVGSQGQLYGAFTGLIVFELYVYWSALIVLVGAQVDCALHERGNPEQG